MHLFVLGSIAGVFAAVNGPVIQDVCRLAPSVGSSASPYYPFVSPVRLALLQAEVRASRRDVDRIDRKVRAGMAEIIRGDEELIQSAEEAVRRARARGENADAMEHVLASLKRTLARMKEPPDRRREGPAADESACPWWSDRDRPNYRPEPRDLNPGTGSGIG